jgi:putative ABC transport system ATP-binding protein
VTEDERVTAIRLENIAVDRRKRQGSAVLILSQISFSARSGEVTAIVGPSGSGKSTLIRLINRLDDPASGAIYLQDTDISTIDPLQLRRQVAMVLQKPFMFEGTVLDNLQRPFVYRQEPPPTAGSAEIRDVLELVRLDGDLIDRDARSLSLGEQQRVNLARALITRPQVLLLDEPTSALDRPTADRLAATLKEVCRVRELAAILVSHDLRLVQNTADRLIYLEAGRILEEGNAIELLTHPGSPELRRFLSGTEETEV